MPRRRFELALALLQGPRPSAVEAAAPREREFAMATQRIAITSPKAGSSRAASVQMPVKGRLKGIEVFVDTPDSGDRISVTLKDKVLVDRLFVDLASNASYEKRFDEDVDAGDILTLSYFSNGTTSKTASWTPELRTRE